MLVVAGSLLRAEAGQDESQVLFRALRDFNIPKILAPVRFGTIGGSQGRERCRGCSASSVFTS